MASVQDSAGGAIALLASNEGSFRDNIRSILQEWFFAVDEVADGNAAKRYLRGKLPDIALLDFDLPPRFSALEMCRDIRQDPRLRRLPIIVLGSRDDEKDAIDSLQAGADDFVVKTGSEQLLIARMKAVLRRSGWNQREIEPETKPAIKRDFSRAAEILSWGDITVYPDQHLVMRGSDEIHLAGQSYKILEYLLRNPVRVLTKKYFEENIRQRNGENSERSLDSAVKRLRKALKPSNPVLTIYGVGHKLAPEP